MSQQTENTPEAEPEKIILGRITGVYGVKGWVKVFSYTDPMESIVDYNPWFLRPEGRKKAPWDRVKLKAGKRQAKTVIAKLEGCNDRDQSQGLIGREVAIDAAQLETLQGADEYYWRDLIGLKVSNTEGIDFGEVKSLIETGANDVLVVSDGERERLIPWLMQDVILSVDLQQGQIEVDWDADF